MTGAASAPAAVVNPEMVGVTSAVGSFTRTVTATCPAGKQLTGAGAAKSASAGGQVALTAIRPSTALTKIEATAAEDGSGYTGLWDASAWAICSDPLPLLIRKAVTSPSDSLNKTVTATCGTGRKVIGGAAETITGRGQVVLTAIRPNPTLTAVTASAAEDDDGFARNWSVTAYAICATPPAGLQLVTVPSGTTSADKAATASCPGGKDLLGGGGATTRAGGQVAMELLPSPDGVPQSLTVRGFEDEDGIAASWNVTAYAICAATAHRSVASVTTTTDDELALEADCNPGKALTGVGADLQSAGGEAVLNEIAPLDADTVSVNAEVDETGREQWGARAFGICATPLPGLEITTAAYSPLDSLADKAANAQCPAGKVAVGAGISADPASPPFGQVHVRLMERLANSIFASAAANEDETGFAGDWGPVAYAFCATSSSAYQAVIADSPPNSDPGSATATCPGDKHLLSAGGSIVGGAGQVVMDDVRPDAALKSVTVTGLEDENGYSEDWSVRAYAICTNP